MKFKKTFKLFTLDAFESEEKYLEKMSLAGWHFINTTGFLYKFEKGESKNYTYKLDYKKDNIKDMETYKSIYKDCGWKNIFEFKSGKGAWEYFRKKTPKKEKNCLQTMSRKLNC